MGQEEDEDMIRIISDSTCDLSPELIQRYNINILPLHILLGVIASGENAGLLLCRQPLFLPVFIVRSEIL